MRLAVTGADGFLGWHVRCRAYALGIPCAPLRRGDLSDPAHLADRLADVDAVIHCAGVNRASDTDITEGNLAAARVLTAAIARLDHPVRVVYANSVQARTDSLYGVAKRRAGEVLSGDGLSDVVLPNLFGEHGRPHYNSFVSTFCHEIANGGEPRVVDDREIGLLHVQDAAEVLIEQAGATGHTVVDPPSELVTVSGVLRLLREFEAVYRTGELPDIAGRFETRLFNTYRSYLFPARYPIMMTPRTDARGSLVECVRTGSAGGQAFISITVPGATRGEHLHLRKFERFLVVDGEAEIALRRLFTKEVIRFRVSGERPGAIDMPTTWVHNITNVGRRPVTTLFWSNELFDPSDPDTFPCAVDSGEACE